MAERALQPMTRQGTLPETDYETGYQLTGNPARDLAASPNVRIILFLLLHVPLAFVAEAVPQVSTALGLVVAYFGLRAALLRRPVQVMAVVAYAAGAEVLWRMTRAQLFWEYSKYLSVAVVGVALLIEWRSRNDRGLKSFWPIILMVTLIPASVLTIVELGVGGARDPLSFNLSGYLALAAMALYFWARPIGRRETEQILIALMAPIVGVASLAVYSTVTTSQEFLSASNWVTSGNYGPNQVSNLLGLGALAGSMLLVIMRGRSGARGFILLLTFVFLGQAVMTFSRGGVYSYVLALMVFGFHLMRSPQSRRFFALLAVGGFALLLVVFPRLDSYTAGVLGDRFSELDSTGRLEAAEADLTAFRDNPLVGTGVGLAVEYRVDYEGVGLAAHTEFTRLLAEHGLFGILTLFVLVWMLLKRYAANSPGLSRAMTAALAVWSMSIMAHSALRMVSIATILALALVSWRLELAQTDDAPAAAAEPVAATTRGARASRMSR
jgi:O-antigen ligase